jgi:hypothetical protein
MQSVMILTLPRNIHNGELANNTLRAKEEQTCLKD